MSSSAKFLADHDGIFNFITEPEDDKKCSICLKVATDPLQDEECGKLFCRKCIEQYGMDKPCPSCKEKPQYFEDKKSWREIKSINVKCDNMERGCPWEGTVGTLEEHMGVCEFTLVPCPKKCKQGNFITKRDIQQHLEKECPNRDYSCEHCDLKGTYATLDHYDTCEKKIISCTNEGCTMEMERMKIKNHLSEECEHTVISCKYTSIGCDVKLKRKDMRAHELDDKAHLYKTVDTVIKLREKMENDDIIREETAKENSDQLEARLVKMQNEMAKLSREKDDQLEDKVAISEVNIRAETARSLKDREDKLNRRLKYIVIAVVILLVAVGYPLYNHYHDLQATAKKQVDDLQATKFTMQQQINDLRATKFTMQQQVDDLRANLQQQQNRQATLQQDLQATMKQQNDDIKATKFTVQQQVDDLQATLQQENDDLQATKHYYDSMTFELTDYRKKMDNNVSYYSPSFYTSLNGYNMKIRVDANGHGRGEGSHVSVSACIVKGKYDDNLNWPFVGDITFQLLNQLEEKNHYSTIFNITSYYNMTIFSDSCWGSRQFYSIRSLLHDSTSTTQYLKNDTLYFRVSAQASGHRPWLECTTDMENEMGKKIIKVVEKNHMYVMTFKLPGYKEKKDNNEVFISPSFYTSPNGYHMKIEVNANGYGDSKGSHVSIFAYIIKGKYDDKLNWPFVGVITFKLLNQLKDEDHHSNYVRILPDLNFRVEDHRGHLQYIPHSYLEPDSPYLQDDTLYFRVYVDMLDPKTL